MIGRRRARIALRPGSGHDSPVPNHKPIGAARSTALAMCTVSTLCTLLAAGCGGVATPSTTTHATLEAPWFPVGGAMAVALRPAAFPTARSPQLARWAVALGLDPQQPWVLSLRTSALSPLVRATEDVARLLKTPPAEGLEAWLAVNPLPAAWIHVRLVGPARDEAPLEPCPTGASDDCAASGQARKALAAQVGALQAEVVGQAPSETLAFLLDATPEGVAALTLEPGARLYRPLSAALPAVLMTRLEGEQRVLDLVVDLGPGPGGLVAGFEALPPMPVARLADPGPWVVSGRADLEVAALAGRVWSAAQALGFAVGAPTVEARAALEALAAESALVPALPGGARFTLADTPQGLALDLQTDRPLATTEPGFGPSELAASAGTAFAWRGGDAPQDPSLAHGALLRSMAGLAGCGWPCATAWLTWLPETGLATQPAPGVVALRWPDLTPAGPVAVAGDAENHDLARLSVAAPLGPFDRAALRWSATPGGLQLDGMLRWAPAAAAVGP